MFTKWTTTHTSVKFELLDHTDHLDHKNVTKKIVHKLFTRQRKTTMFNNIFKNGLA